VPEKFVVTFKPGKEMEEKVRELEEKYLRGPGRGSDGVAKASHQASEPPAA
jgi:hypothetical protein